MGREVQKPKPAATKERRVHHQEMQAKDKK